MSGPVTAERLTVLGREVLIAAHENADVVGIVTRDAIARHVSSTPQGVSRALGRLRDLGLVEQTLPGAISWVVTRAGAQLLDVELNGSARCRMCGCTENVACGAGCWWTEPDLCSSCGSTVAGQLTVDEVLADIQTGGTS